MPKRLLKRLMPHHSKIREHRHLRHLGERLHDPNLWHLNRYSASSAMALGLFVCYLPIPFQMLIAAMLAIWLRTNLIIATAMVWISNPITMPAMFYFAYKTGTIILGYPEKKLAFELSFEWLGNGLLAVWQPFLLGSLICATVLAAVGYVGTRLLWRLMVIRKWRSRHRKPRPVADPHEKKSST